jgi:hypothetical protein
VIADVTETLLARGQAAREGGRARRHRWQVGCDSISRCPRDQPTRGGGTPGGAGPAAGGMPSRS